MWGVTLDSVSSGSGGVAIEPRGEYQRRLDVASARVALLARRDDAGANLRLVAFVALVVLGILTARGSIAWTWPIGVVVAFVILVGIHGRAVAARRKAEGIADYYRKGLGRLDGDWAGKGVPGTRFLNEGHPYAADLDLFGVGSLFERLCLAQTAAGETTLAGWLLARSSVETIAIRHDAVKELRGKLDLREDLAFLGHDVRAAGDPEVLARWGDDAPAAGPAAWRWVTFAVVAATVAALAGWMAESVGPRWFLGLLAVECVVALAFRPRVSHALAGIAERGPELAHLAALLGRIEREPFESTRMRELVEDLGVGPGSPSRRLAHLAGLLTWLEARHNTLFTLLAALLLWKTQFGLGVATWRAAHGKEIGRWIAAIGEIEALSSIAGYAFENPDDPFPEFDVEGRVADNDPHEIATVSATSLIDLPEKPPILEADGLGHPLLAVDRCVRNDIRLGVEPSVLAVSGSNMSGKSTWLRTVGANVVLAQAGAPVRAKWMRLSPLAVGGTLKVHDSLQEGKSRFYAEILRLRQLLDLAKGPTPLLFLIDEVLAGTNSHDRLQGAEAVIRGLLDRGAIGLFTTHDLTLAEVAESLAPRATNVHFADHLDADGRLAFDYTMRPGVVRQSNALALMRAVGLEV